MSTPFRALTLTAKNGLLRALITDCKACAAFSPDVVPPDQRPKLEPFKAIWDTGATASVITQQVVDRCGLKPTGMTKVQSVHGAQPAETFLVNFMLPNGVGLANVRVTLGQLAEADLLLGMDVITRGDFAITNVGGNTVFSFRVPSVAKVDYVEEADNVRQQNALRAARAARKGRHRHKRPWD